MRDIYHSLAEHLKGLAMGYPITEALVDLLRGSYHRDEAKVLLGVPTDMAPLEMADADTIAGRAGLSLEEAGPILESLAHRNLVFSGKTMAGRPGYALFQIGYGMPQAHFWHGRHDDTSLKMAKLIRSYFTIPVTRDVYGGVETKPFKYTPVGIKVEVGKQGVLPHEEMGPIIEKAEKIALAHCPCRVSARVLGRTDCDHSLEVCFKYDGLAEFLISRDMGRLVSKDEALHVMGQCEKEGLVHMVDNAQGDIKHTCNCCGCYCWNVGVIRRRKIPRDVLMQVNFIRETEQEACVGCGACADICPVDAVEMTDDVSRLDSDWCIGCGVCAGVCPADAISIVRRTPERGPDNFSNLHRQIRKERFGH